MISDVQVKTNKELPTIETILELSSRAQLDAFNFLCRKNSIENETEGVVAQSSNDGLGVDQARYTGPANVLLQFLESERRGMQQRRSRASGGIIAEEGKCIAANWKTKGDQSCTYWTTEFIAMMRSVGGRHAGTTVVNGTERGCQLHSPHTHYRSYSKERQDR